MQRLTAICALSALAGLACPSAMVRKFAATKECRQRQIQVVCDVEAGVLGSVFLLDRCGEPRLFQFTRDGRLHHTPGHVTGVRTTPSGTVKGVTMSAPSDSLGGGQYIDVTMDEDLAVLARHDWQSWSGDCPEDVITRGDSWLEKMRERASRAQAHSQPTTDDSETRSRATH